MVGDPGTTGLGKKGPIWGVGWPGTLGEEVSSEF